MTDSTDSNANRRAPLLELIPTLPQLLWFFLAVILILAFRKEIGVLSGALVYRLQSGGQVKIASLELEAIKTKDRAIVVPSHVKVSESDQLLREEREEYYRKVRNVVLVHKLARSTVPGQEYEIMLYLAPHVSPQREGTLVSIKRVEYYFGGMWGDRVFVSEDRGRAFQIVVSAYGPMLCIARVTFSDANPKDQIRGRDYEILHRYVDFEMGAYAPEQEPPRKQDGR